VIVCFGDVGSNCSPSLFKLSFHNQCLLNTELWKTFFFYFRKDSDIKVNLLEPALPEFKETSDKQKKKKLKPEKFALAKPEKLTVEDDVSHFISNKHVFLYTILILDDISCWLDGYELSFTEMESVKW